MLGGTVDNFQGNAVDPLWTVTFERTPVDNTVVVEAGLTVAYWPERRVVCDFVRRWYGARPIGIFGGFNAHFTDGHAAGAFATRK